MKPDYEILKEMRQWIVRHERVEDIYYMSTERYMVTNREKLK